MRILNNITKSHPIAFHRNGGYENCKVGQDLFHDKLINKWEWNTSEVLRDDITLCFAKWGDDGENTDFLLDENIQRFNLSYLNIGENFNQIRLPSLDGRAKKPYLLHASIDKITTKYVMGWDIDVFFMDHPNRVVERFENEFECDWLFNAEHNYHPKSALEIYTEWDKYDTKVCNSPFKYLNSGLFIAKVDFFKEIFEDIVNTPLLKNSAEQGQFHQIYRKYFPRMQIDFGCKIFQSLFMLNKNCLEVVK